MSQVHQLAAVLFTDIVGYTAIMQSDETAALERINRFKEVLESNVEAHKGKIIQYYGDGCLLIFGSAVEAVEFGIAVQEEFCKDSQVPARVGIHMGDVLFKEGNIYGDAVNIASRIQALAPAGGIMVSETVQKNIANKKTISTEYVKTETLKNVKEPVKIFRIKTQKHKPFERSIIQKKKIIYSVISIIVLAGVYILYNSFIASNKKTPVTNLTESTSIAVLPFKDNSPGKDQEYLGDGIAEELLNQLAQIKELKVKGRASSFSFKGKENDLQNISKVLDVKIFLIGSIQKFGSLVRIYIQLINAKDDDIIWADQYDAELKDIFLIQDSIATEISEKLKFTLFNSENNPARVVNPEAYETVLKGNFFFNKGDFQKAIDSYQKAIALDSGYAYPYIRLGWTIYQLTLFNRFTPREGLSQAEALLTKGLKLDPSLSERKSAHHALAYINLWQYKWKESFDEYSQSVVSETSPSTALSFYLSFVYKKTGDAVSIMKKVVDENPLDMLSLRDFSVIQYFDGQFNEAKQTCDRIIELDPNFSESYRLKGTIYYLEKKYDSALYELDKAERLGNPWAGPLTIMTLCRLDRREEARALFSSKEKNIAPFAKALIYESFGEKDKAFVWLNQSYEQRDFWLASLKVDPIWNPLRSDSRFIKLMNKMNFPPEGR